VAPPVPSANEKERSTMAVARPIRLIAAFVFAASCAGASAQDARSFPSKPLTIVVPFPAGGTSDILARTIGQRLSQAWGQPVVVENRPGASGNIGAAAVAKSPPDGHTLLVGAAAISTAAALYKDPGFRLFESLAPVTVLGTVPFMLVVHPAMPAKSVAEFVDYAKKHPNKLSLGSGGNGTIPHLGGELFKQRAGIAFTHVPYKGGAQAMADLVAGQIDFTIDGGAHVVSQIDAGKVRMLAVTTPERLAQYPNVPTVAESGFPGYAASAWQMLLVPAATPRPIVEKIQAEVSRAINAPDIAERIRAMGIVPSGMPTAESEAFLRAEMAKWSDVISKSGAKLD
jgi:tripartite-type tricarboxylate transporter receptor subunit TctC